MTQPEFGKRLREQRLRKGLSQADLSGDGLSTSYVSLLESGRRQATRKVAIALAERLEIDVDYLLTGQDRPARQERELELRFVELALLNGDPREARRTLERLRATTRPDDPDRWNRTSAAETSRRPSRSSRNSANMPSRTRRAGHGCRSSSICPGATARLVTSTVPSTCRNALWNTLGS